MSISSQYLHGRKQMTHAASTKVDDDLCTKAGRYLKVPIPRDSLPDTVPSLGNFGATFATSLLLILSSRSVNNLRLQ